MTTSAKSFYKSHDLKLLNIKIFLMSKNVMRGEDKSYLSSFRLIWWFGGTDSCITGNYEIVSGFNLQII